MFIQGWYCPLYVVHLTIQDRDACMCKIHENLCFVVDKLKQLSLLTNSNLERLTEEVSCSTNSKECMYGEWLTCKLKSLPLATVHDACYILTVGNGGEREDHATSKWGYVIQSDSQKKQLKALYRSSLSISLVCCMFKKCVFNIKQLFSFYRELKRSLSS